MTTFADDNPYDVLEIDTDADESVIKAAYRRLARKWHPDHCKDPNAHANFCRVQNAYDLLMDAEQRAHYNLTGVKGDPSPDPAARATLIGLVLPWAQNAEVHQDFRIFARAQLAAQAQNLAAAIESRKNLAAKVKRKVTRLTRKTAGENFLTIALENCLAELQDNIRMTTRQLKTTKRALELLEDFDYDARPDRLRTFTLGFTGDASLLTAYSDT